MATVLDVIKGLNQAAANAYDGALDEDGEANCWGENTSDKNNVPEGSYLQNSLQRFELN